MKILYTVFCVINSIQDLLDFVNAPLNFFEANKIVLIATKTGCFFALKNAVKILFFAQPRFIENSGNGLLDS